MQHPLQNEGVWIFPFIIGIKIYLLQEGIIFLLKELYKLSKTGVIGLQGVLPSIGFRFGFLGVGG